jgi:hypothetical protein
MAKHSLKPAENEHLRGLVRLLLMRYTQRALAPLIGMTQGAISGFLTEHHGTSMAAAKQIAELSGLTLDDVRALRWPDIPDRYPNRARAVALARSLPKEYLSAAIELVDSMDRNGEDLPVRTWLKMLDYWDEHLRFGHPSPLKAPGRWSSSRHAPYLEPGVPKRQRDAHRGTEPMRVPVGPHAHGAATGVPYEDLPPTAGSRDAEPHDAGQPEAQPNAPGGEPGGNAAPSLTRGSRPRSRRGRASNQPAAAAPEMPASGNDEDAAERTRRGSRRG